MLYTLERNNRTMICALTRKEALTALERLKRRHTGKVSFIAHANHLYLTLGDDTYAVTPDGKSMAERAVRMVWA